MGAGRKRLREVDANSQAQSSLVRTATQRITDLLRLEAVHERHLSQLRGELSFSKGSSTLSVANTAMRCVKLRRGKQGGAGALIVERRALLPPGMSPKCDDSRRLCTSWCAQYSATDTQARLSARPTPVRCLRLADVDVDGILANGCVADVIERTAQLLETRAIEQAELTTTTAPDSGAARSVEPGAAASQLATLRCAVVATVKRMRDAQCPNVGALALADRACEQLQMAVDVALLPTQHPSGRPRRSQGRPDVLLKLEALAARGERTLRVKEAVGELRPIEMHVFLRALRENRDVRVLYLQSCGMRPEHLSSLLQVLLSARQIWAVNLGEMAENPTALQLRTFVQVLRSTSVAFAYMSEPVFKSRACHSEKKAMRAALRENRRSLLEVKSMWCNPSEKYLTEWGEECVAESPV